MNFDHKSLVCPLDRDGAQELCCRLVGFLADQPPRFRHEYDGRQSSGGDQRLVGKGKLGNKFVGTA